MIDPPCRAQYLTSRRIAFSVIALLQLADLMSTWLGMRQGLSEADGTTLAHLVLLKFGVLAVVALLARGRVAWVACGAFAAVMVPVLANNLILIMHAH